MFLLNRQGLHEVLLRNWINLM